MRCKYLIDQNLRENKLHFKREPKAMERTIMVFKQKCIV